MKKLITLSFLTFFSLLYTTKSNAQTDHSYTATHISQVESYYYTPYISDLRKIKARFEIQGSDPIANKNYTFSLYFYEDISAKGTNSVRDSGSRTIINLYYPIEDFFYYDKLLNEIDRTQIRVTYEMNSQQMVDHFLIKRTKN